MMAIATMIPAATIAMTATIMIGAGTVATIVLIATSAATPNGTIITASRCVADPA
jgi:hypothetical protein